MTRSEHYIRPTGPYTLALRQAQQAAVAGRAMRAAGMVSRQSQWGFTQRPINRGRGRRGASTLTARWA